MIRELRPGRIALYPTEKHKRLLARQVRKKTGADVVINGSLFDWSSWKPVCDVKCRGKVLSDDKWSYRGLAWNEGDDHFTVDVTKNMDRWENFLSCVFLIWQGKPLTLQPSSDVGRSAARSAVFQTKNGTTCLYCDKTPLTPWQLRDLLLRRGDVDWALLLDGGGSVQLSQAGTESVYSSRKVHNYLCFWENPPEDREPKGEKPMVEINAYSKAKDGEQRLSAHFKVKEFACHDGADAVLCAPRLVMVLESIRTHFGQPLIIRSGYRTSDYNDKIKGAAHSQHCYGTAADIAVQGVKPEEVADFARQLMPDWGGVGRYASFVHVDVRETKADWKG